MIQSVVATGCQNIDVLHFAWLCQNTAMLQNWLILFSAKIGAVLHDLRQSSGVLNSMTSEGS